MNRRRLLLLGVLALGTAPLACGAPAAAPTGPTAAPPGTSSPGHSPAAPAGSGGGLADPARRRVAEAVVSSFENSTTALPYDSAERLDDGRGVTAGRAGFTSGTHDLLLVLERYEGDDTTSLSRYRTALLAIDRRIREGGDGGDTEGLDGFEAAWRSTSRSDPRLRRAQDAVYDELYFRPAMDRAARAGVRTALGQLVLLDTAVQHGTEDDPDGLPTLVQETADDRGVPGDDEPGWLRALLRVRRAHLLAPAEEETAEVWRASTPRVDTLLALLDAGALELATPLRWTFAGQRFAV